jgi:glycerol-3-phosphate O-acyltransferase/dihydroxyacetone phosphate acyltransferase
MGSLARLLIRVFFRRVQIEHRERVDLAGPTVLVANHRNGLVDGLLLMATLPRFPRFLGKSTLFHIPVLWPFLKLAGVVPVYRAQDGAPADRNRETFARSSRLLAKGGLLALFPEGISHDEPALQPLRTGAARIALAAAGDGVADVKTVAVALVYDDKQRFRSQALVKVGHPEPTDRWLGAYRADERAAVRGLTDELTGRLRDLGPDYRSWSEADILSDAADITARAASDLSASSDLPRDVALEDRDAIATVLAQAAATGSDPAVASVRAAVAAYRYQLALVGLDDAQVAAGFRSGRLRRKLVWAWASVGMALPFAAAGAVIHALPYLVVKRLSRIPANEGMRATVKLLGCFFLFVVVYATVGVAVGVAFGPWWGLLASLLAPACGYTAVRMAERIRRIGGAVEGYRAIRRGNPMLPSVLEARAAVVAATAAVTGQRPPDTGPERDRPAHETAGP